MKKIGVILVNYNGEKYNEECINSILNSSYSNIEIVVVDNNSQDQSVKQLLLNYKDKIKLINLEDNIGFSGANNIGIDFALKNGCEYVLLLNNDTVINDSMIEEMVNTSIHYNDRAMICPKIYYYDHKDIIWSAGGYINWLKGITIQYGMNEKDTGKYDERKKIEFATGCCLLIHKNIIDSVGKLSEEYFLYYEDTDYCMRVKNEGYNIVYEPKATMFHKVSASTGGEKSKTYIYYLNRNRLFFNEKYNKKFYIFITYYYLVLIIKNMLRKNKDQVYGNKYIKLAIKDYRKNNYGKRKNL